MLEMGDLYGPGADVENEEFGEKCPGCGDWLYACHCYPPYIVRPSGLCGCSSQCPNKCKCPCHGVRRKR